jgi:hypothetical protein
MMVFDKTCESYKAKWITDAINCDITFKKDLEVYIVNEFDLSHVIQKFYSTIEKLLMKEPNYLGKYNSNHQIFIMLKYANLVINYKHDKPQDGSLINNMKSLYIE